MSLLESFLEPLLERRSNFASVLSEIFAEKMGEENGVFCVGGNRVYEVWILLIYVPASIGKRKVHVRNTRSRGKPAGLEHFNEFISLCDVGVEVFDNFTKRCDEIERAPNGGKTPKHNILQHG